MGGRVIQIRFLANDPILILEVVRGIKRVFPNAKFNGIKENTRHAEKFGKNFMKYRGYITITIPLEKPKDIDTIPGCFGHYAKPLEGLECLSCPLRDLCWEASTS
jgi:hypothetical protein